MKIYYTLSLTATSLFIEFSKHNHWTHFTDNVMYIKLFLFIYIFHERNSQNHFLNQWPVPREPTFTLFVWCFIMTILIRNNAL